MVDFASLNTNLPETEVTETDLLIGFGKGCNGQAGMPMTASYLNTVLQWFCRCLVPKGGIMLWSGAAADVPTGWAICDGSNGTPNLQGKFAIGVSDDYAEGSSGGVAVQTTSSVAPHNHTGSTNGHALTIAQMPSHDHNVLGEIFGTNPQRLDAGNDNDIYTVATPFTTDLTGGGEEHTHDIGEDGGHDHTVDVLPPYCAVHYIMKL